MFWGAVAEYRLMLYYRPAVLLLDGSDSAARRQLVLQVRPLGQFDVRRDGIPIAIQSRGSTRLGSLLLPGISNDHI